MTSEHARRKAAGTAQRRGCGSNARGVGPCTAGVRGERSSDRVSSDRLCRLRPQGEPPAATRTPNRLQWN